MTIARLDRTIFRLSGQDAPSVFLSGLITNSLRGPISFAGLLTPQGKVIADFFVTPHEDTLLIDTPRKFGPDLLARLKMYKLRAKIEIADVSEALGVYALWGEDFAGHPDPRSSALGYRQISEGRAVNGDAADYDLHRLRVGIPDSATDFETAQVFPADANMDLLSGVDFKKGCFIGQEVVSRMHRKTEVRKRMCGFICAGAKPGDALMIGETKVGDVLHVQGRRGMALLRLDRIAARYGEITLGGASVELGNRLWK